MLGPLLQANSPKSFAAEFLGTAFLALIVVGSGLQGPALGAEPGSSLLINVGATALALWALITLFGQLSGAHFNPAVTAMLWLRREISVGKAFSYVFAQLFGATIGVAGANLMFTESAFSWSSNLRANFGTGLAELVATTGLLLIIVLLGAKGSKVAAVGVATWIGAAALATSSTAFANPALSVARIFAADGSGIDPFSAVIFVAVEVAAIACGWILIRIFEPQTEGEK